MNRDTFRWLYEQENLETEWIQAQREGLDTDSIAKEVEEVLQMPLSKRDRIEAARLMRRLEELPVRADFPYREPESYEEIRKALPKEAQECFDYRREEYKNRVYYGITGRFAGCLLGMPVETWSVEKIAGFMKEAQQDPCTGFFHSRVEERIREKYGIADEDDGTRYDRMKECWINNCDHIPVDDDINYTVLALRLLERYGADFSSQDAAENWIYAFPAAHACTAERVAYRNILCGIPAPDCGKRYNPFREWIGAQIRADLFGYVCPGNPCLAAEMAYREASVSHTKNGVYGAMLTAALNSLAFCMEDALSLYRHALRQIPADSRLYEAVSGICDAFGEGKTYESVIADIYRQYDEQSFYDWCHVIPNAMLVAANLLYYGKDYDLAVGNTVKCGFDTDCNAATVGSVAGILNNGVPKYRICALGGRVETSIHSYHDLTAEEIADRICAQRR